MKSITKWLQSAILRPIPELDNASFPGSPWENGDNKSFNGKLHNELLDCEIFFTLEEAKTLIARWREEDNQVRPHSALGYRPPTPQAWLLTQQLISAPGLT